MTADILRAVFGMDRTRTPESLSAGAQTLLALVRPEYIPTVVSNCIAGWWLGGGGHTGELLVVLSGSVLVFLGGAFLNDAFDVSYDRQHRRGRPVPAGRVGLRLVWRCGLLLLLMGTSCLQWPGRFTGGLAMALTFTVVLHNSMHRLTPFSPAFVGLCRFFLYLLGASTAMRGITGMTMWSGIAMALFVTGFESLHSDPEHRKRLWLQAIALACPLFFAGVANTGAYLPATAIMGGGLIAWALLSWVVLRRTSTASHGSVSLFICAVPLVDMLLACPAPLSAFSTEPSAAVDMCLILLSLFGVSVILSVAQAVAARRLAQDSTQPSPRQAALFGS